MAIEKRKTPCPQSRRFGSNDQGQTVQHAYSGRLIGCARPQMLGRQSPSISAARHASACDRDRGRGRGPIPIPGPSAPPLSNNMGRPVRCTVTKLALATV
jgi:hypothetical protein